MNIRSIWLLSHRKLVAWAVVRSDAWGLLAAARAALLHAGRMESATVLPAGRIGSALVLVRYEMAFRSDSIANMNVSNQLTVERDTQMPSTSSLSYLATDVGVGSGDSRLKKCSHILDMCLPKHDASSRSRWKRKKLSSSKTLIATPDVLSSDWMTFVIVSRVSCDSVADGF
nr:hypothetical protein Iba_chr08dCG8480 [Ipomoea batatas]